MNVLTRLRRAPKTVALAATVVAALATTVYTMAWGPDRPTFTQEKPATYVTFNSITNNSRVGDERNFVVVKDAANTQDGGWQDSVNVQPGKEYLVRVYVHNNAAANLNLKAVNTRVAAAISKNTGKSVPITGYVSADNAKPQKVWDDVTLTSDKDFNLAYVPGSATIYNNGYANGGKPLGDDIVNPGGARIGYTGQNGEVPGCFQYANYIFFKVKPQFAKTPNFEVNKTVSKSGAFDWKENVDTKAGDKVDFRIQYKNTGETQQDNVVIKDKLPAGMTYVAGSTKLYNAKNPNGKVLSDNVTKDGVNIGSHAPGASSFVVFTAQMAKNDDLAECGVNRLKNIATVETPNGSKDDDATVTITKDCPPTPGKIEVCDMTDNTIKTINESDFDSAKHTKDLSKCKAPEQPAQPTPEVSELPQTGMDGGILAILGVGAVTALGAALLTSRRVS